MTRVCKVPGLQDRYCDIYERDGDRRTFPGQLDPAGHAVYTAVDRGEIDPGQALPLMAAYLTAGMDTTINSISNALWLFGLFPHEWEKLRRGELSPAAAFNEVLRFESPVYVFARTAARDVAFGQVTVPEGSRVAVLYGSANRDERRWSHAESFDVSRHAADHLGFGYGTHGCAGQGLVRLEAQALLAALVRQVERIEVSQPVRRLNNGIRGLESLSVTLVPA